MRYTRDRCPLIDIERFTQMAASGESIPRMAAILHVSARTVSRYKRTFGLTQDRPGYRKLPDGWHEQAEQLLADGYSKTDVARITGVNFDTVTRHFPGHAWTPQQVGEYAAMIRRLNQVPTHPNAAPKEQR